MHKAIKIASKYVWSFIVEKISIVQTCDGKKLKATDYIIKVAIIRGNITWHSFALRACISKNKKRMITSASFCEGSIFYFYVFTFHARVNSVLLYSLFFFLQASCGGERSRHIYPVGYRWSWVIIVDITLEVNKLGGEIISPYLSMCAAGNFAPYLCH